MIPVSGPMMQEKALAKQLNQSYFKASTGWPSSFKQRHNINGARICGESGSVDVGVVTDWQEKLPSITEGYGMHHVTSTTWMNLVCFTASFQIARYAFAVKTARAAKNQKNVLLLFCAATWLVTLKKQW